MPANTTDVQQSSSLREDSGVLPPPSALFGSSCFYPTTAAPSTATAASTVSTSGVYGEGSPSPRPVFILPPPTSLQGYHLHPPHATMQPFLFPPTPSPPHLSMSRSSDTLESSGPPYGMYYYQQYPMPSPSSNSTLSNSTVEEKQDDTPKRKRRGDARKKQSGRSHQSPPSTPPNYHYEVIELHRNQPQRKRPTKKQRKEHEAVSAAAATLASFATASPYDTTPPSTPPYYVPGQEEECDDLEEAVCVGSGPLECSHCGITFRHTNCLQRHRLEHDDGWKELQGRALNKQQQAQLLEAAQILMDIARYGMRMRVVN
ncbi:hypothetical protein BDF14DRAFT_1743982 [Spinellus fusiger]|nr:hypothetical protein BDF14DRAFT_1743982 [Spinellus fusiger]